MRMAASLMCYANCKQCVVRYKSSIKDEIQRYKTFGMHVLNPLNICNHRKSRTTYFSLNFAKNKIRDILKIGIWVPLKITEWAPRNFRTFFALKVNTAYHIGIFRIDIEQTTLTLEGTIVTNILFLSS